MIVAMLDLRATTPYYDAGLCLALAEQGATVLLYSPPPRLDPELFDRLGVAMGPGVVGVVERKRLGHQLLRRVLRVAELGVNVTVSWLQLLVRPPDVVHLQWLSVPEAPVLDLALMRWARRRGSRVVLTVHNVRPHEGGGRALSAVYAAPDMLLCHTRSAAEQLEREFDVEPARVTVVHEGPIAGQPLVPRSSNAPDASVRVLFCGVIRPYKGASVLLDAWSEVERRVPGGHLTMAGGGHGEEIERIRQDVARRGLRRVTLRLESLSSGELDELHAQSDIAVLPYLQASGSEALIRAMTAGLAVVASATGGLQEWVRDDETGVLVPPGDPRALCDALVAVIADATLRARYGAAAQEHLRSNLSWSEAARRTLAVYSA